MCRIAIVALMAALVLPGSALAQIPAGPGQQPGTLPPAPPVYIPPPPPPPRPVPSVVTPLPNPTYGVPPGVTAPIVSGSGGLRHTIRSTKPKKRKTPRRYRGSSVR
jgi:hypothetical protein